MTSRPACALQRPRDRRPEDAQVVLQRLWRDVRAARRAIARGGSTAITHTARGLLSGLASLRVRVELAYAAASFADAREDRPAAEEWVRFAVSARATLESARKNGAAVLGDELDELDEAFEEDAREAVLLLAPEDYREALAGTPPKARAWWGERARLDAGLPEIDLERALALLARV